MSLAHSQPRSAAAASAIRVMVVDDSVFVRGVICRWLAEDKQFELVATHANGLAAVEDLARARPDVVILDLEMPEMDGLTALPLILKQRPNTAVIVASALTRRGAEVSMKALTLGAADYVPKPDAAQGSLAKDAFKSELTAKVRSLGRKAQTARDRNPAAGGAVLAPAAPLLSARLKMPERMRPYSLSPVTALAIGSSTGGPQALTKLFAAIGPYLGRVPVFVTQHMPATFTAILAEHLRQAAGIPAAEGVDGEVVGPGRIYVAPGGRHMVPEKSGGATIIRLSDEPPVNFCKPAVDPMFGAVSAVYRSGLLGLVLTGMGCDGAQGAGIVTNAGGSVIVQDEESSVVWGMPGATAAAGNTCEVLSLDAIGRKVIRLLGGRP